MFKYIGYAASIGEENIYKTIDFAKENNMNSVEINMNVPIYFPENFNKEERLKIKEYAENKGVKITMHAPEDITLLQLHPSIRKTGLDRLKEIITFGIDIGVSRMTLHVGSAVCFTLIDRKSYMEEFYGEEYKNILKESLQELVHHAGDKLMICVENSGRFPEKIVQEVIQELLENTNLYLTWDIGHSYENKYNEIEFFIRNIDKVRTCHIHDNNGKSDHQIPGTGNLNFNKHFDLMKGKDIIYIIEVRPRQEALKGLSYLNNNFIK